MRRFISYCSNLIFLLTIAGSCSFCYATPLPKKLSYIYFQGDKELPFYVQVNGKAAERYFKNCCVVGNLDSGTYDITILFEQNRQPPFTAKINVPEAGFRSLMICRHNGAYALYDLEAKKYID